MTYGAVVAGCPVESASRFGIVVRAIIESYPPRSMGSERRNDEVSRGHFAISPREIRGGFKEQWGAAGEYAKCFSELCLSCGELRGGTGQLRKFSGLI